MKETERDRGYDLIRAVSAVAILVFHYIKCVETEVGHTIPYILSVVSSGLYNMGRIGVAWFLLLSGSVLWKTTREGFDIRSFYRKRVLRIFIPLWLGYVFFYITVFVTDPSISHAPLYSVICSLLGMDFYYYYFTGSWDLILVGEWFTSVIVTVYIMYPLFRLAFIRARRYATLLMILLFAVNQKLEILTLYGGTWSLPNGIVLFWMGMLFEEYREKIVSQKASGWICLAAALLMYVFFRDYRYGYTATFLFSVISYIPAYSLSFLFRPFDPLIGYFSRYSYEIYLIHHRMQYLLMPVFLDSQSSPAVLLCMFISLTSVTLVLCEKLSYFSSAVQKRLLESSPQRR